MVMNYTVLETVTPMVKSNSLKSPDTNYLYCTPTSTLLFN